MATNWRRRFITACVLLAFACSPRASFATDFPRIYDDDIRSAVNTYWAGGPDWRWWKAQLFQESRLDPSATSQVGAAGLAQFMPATWADVSGRLRYGKVSPYVARYSIAAGAFYMGQLRGQWSFKRPLMEKHRLAQASYNAGLGHVLDAQTACQGALLWDEIKACLPAVTGADNARQTVDYVDRIAAWYGMLLQ